MKSFRFRLEKVLQWRRTEFGLEEFRLRQLTAELRQVDQARRRMEVARARAEREILALRSVQGNDLCTLAAYLAHVRKFVQSALRRREDLARRIEQQNGRLLEARRRLKIMEKLRARRLAEWQSELDREVENIASEAFLVRWKARKQ